MFKAFILFLLVALCCAHASYLAAPGALVYSNFDEYPSASGYEYQHTVQTPDYVNHASVVKPLNGFAAVPQVVRTVYNSAPYPYAYAHAW